MEPQSPVPPPVPQLEGPVVLFASAWKLFTAHWKALVLVVLTPSVIIYIGTALSLSDSVALKVISAFVSLAGVITIIAMQPAAIDAIRKLDTDPNAPVTIKTQYAFGFGYFWPVLFLMILQGLIFFGSAALFLIPAIIVGVYTALCIFTLVLEGARGFAALTASYGLVRGRWVMVLGRLLFLVLLYIIGGLVISGAAFIVDLLFGFQAHSASAEIVSLIGNLFLGAFTGPIALIYIYKLYNSLKATRLPDVSVAGFKKWLVAFLVIGIVCTVLPITFFVIRGPSRAVDYSAYGSNPFGTTVVHPGSGGTATTSDYFPNGQYPGMNGVASTTH